MIVFLLSLLLGFSAQASDEVVTKGKWSKGEPSVLLSQGLKIKDPNLCEKFEVEIAAENLQYKLRCNGYVNSALVPLKSDNTYKVTRGQSSITITKMGYYGQKIQTSKVSQNLVRIPYVEEVLYVSFKNGGQISFYKEKFVVDDFGRVVQGHFVQAYDLTKAQVKISQFRRGKIRYKRSVNQKRVQ